MTDSQPPTNIGPYSVQRELGRGGMGVVYLASDPRLDRSVAIKVLADGMHNHPERLARLSREAKALAAMSHPNVASIYGLEDQELSAGNSRGVLVLEYVPGVTLTERLQAGPIPIDETIQLMAQVAAGLEAAHERGLIHRDLKPDNIKITPDGQVKILDFGLAKADSAFGPAGDAPKDAAPTLAIGTPGPLVTRVGVVMGTPGYMSPEQCRGKPLDKRTDIWSFGCVMFECLAGRQVFRGDTLSDSIAAVLERDPDFAQLPARTPVRVRELLYKCLEKDASRRLRDIGDARIELQQCITKREWTQTVAMSAVMFTPSRRRGVMVASIAGVIGLIAGSLIGWGLARRQDATAIAASVTPPLRLSLVLPDAPRRAGGMNSMLLTPDGKSLIYFATRSESKNLVRANQLLAWQRLDTAASGVFADLTDVRAMALSPDGQWLGVVAKGGSENSSALYKVALDDGQPTSGHSVMIAKDVPSSSQIAWVSADTMVMTATSGKDLGVQAVTVGDGSTRALTNGPRRYWMPEAIPGGKHVLLTNVEGQDQSLKYSVWIQPLDGGEARELLPGGSMAHYVEPGYLVYVHESSYMAVKFDARRGEVIGAAFALAGLDPAQSSGAALCTSGTMAIPPVAGAQGLSVMDANGRMTPLGDLKKSLTRFVEPSPDGERVAVGVKRSEEREFQIDLAFYDPQRQTLTRVPSEGLSVTGAIWHPDGQRVVWSRLDADFHATVLIGGADGGTPQTLYRSEEERRMFTPVAMTPDGASVLLLSWKLRETKADLWIMDVKSGATPAAPKLIRQGLSADSYVRLSPDGRVIAYSKTNDGQPALFVEAFDAANVTDTAGSRTPVSRDAVNSPPWFSKDGREVRFVSGTKLMTATVDREPRLSVAIPKATTDLGSAGDLGAWTINWMPDGRLIAITPAARDARSEAVTIVTNVGELIRRSAPSK